MEPENPIVEQQIQQAPLAGQRRTALPSPYAMGDYRGIYPLRFGEAELFCQEAARLAVLIGDGGAGFGARVMASLCGEHPIRAGTRARGEKLWLMDVIQARYRVIKAEHIAALGKDAKALLAEVSAIAFANPQDAQAAIETGDISKVSREVASTLKVTTTIKKQGKRKTHITTIESLPKDGAQDRLMRYNGMFKEDNSQKVTLPPQINIYAPDSSVTINDKSNGRPTEQPNSDIQNTGL